MQDKLNHHIYIILSVWYFYIKNMLYLKKIITVFGRWFSINPPLAILITFTTKDFRFLSLLSLTLFPFSSLFEFRRVCIPSFSIEVTITTFRVRFISYYATPLFSSSFSMYYCGLISAIFIALRFEFLREEYNCTSFSLRYIHNWYTTRNFLYVCYSLWNPVEHLKMSSAM